MFIIETKVNSKKMERIRKKCGFENGIDISVEGSRRGLSLGWKESISVNLKSFSNPHIDVEVMEENGEAEWNSQVFMDP